MLNPFDTGILQFFANANPPAWLDAFMLFFTDTIQPALMVLSIVLMFFKKTRKAGIAGFLAIFLSAMAIEAVLKGAFARVRPYEAFEWARLLGEPSPTFSFPSGHSSMAFAAATGISWFLQKKWPKVVLFAAAILTAFTRVYISIHWTTDVLAGAVNGILFGLIAAFIVTQFAKLFEKNRAKRAQKKAQS